MNKQELIAAIAGETAIPQSHVTAVVDSFKKQVISELAKGNDVVIHGLGTFTTVQQGERNGRNPQTGDAIKIAARTAAKFRPAAALKDALN